MCQLRPLLPSNHAGALQDPRGPGPPAEVLQRHQQVADTRPTDVGWFLHRSPPAGLNLSLLPFPPTLPSPSFPLPPTLPSPSYPTLSRFHGSDPCVCGEVGVTEQYSQVHWDPFAVEVLHSLYNTAPISMHCNQSDARSFPVSPPFDTRPVEPGGCDPTSMCSCPGGLGRPAAASGLLHPGQSALPL